MPGSSRASYFSLHLCFILQLVPIALKAHVDLWPNPPRSRESAKRGLPGEPLGVCPVGKGQPESPEDSPRPVPATQLASSQPFPLTSRKGLSAGSGSGAVRVFKPSVPSR